MEDLDALIDAFWSGEMTPADQKSFLARLQSDPALAEAYRFRQSLQFHLADQMAAEAKPPAPKPITARLGFRILAGVAAAILILFGLRYVLIQPSPPASLDTAQRIVAYQPFNGSERGIETSPTWEQMDRWMQAENWTFITDSLSQMVDTFPLIKGPLEGRQDTLTFLLAQAIAFEDTSIQSCIHALPYLISVASFSDDPELVDHALELQALIYIRARQWKEAHTILLRLQRRGINQANRSRTSLRADTLILALEASYL